MQSNVTCGKQGYFRVPTSCLCGEDGYAAAADSNLDKCTIFDYFLVSDLGRNFLHKGVSGMFDGLANLEVL